MRSRLPIVTRSLQILVCLASVQIACASCKRNAGLNPDNGQAMARGKVAITDGSGSQGVAAGVDQSMSQGNEQGVGPGAAGQSNGFDQ